MTDQFDSARLLKVQNEKAMVLQFINENGKPTGVGFQAWLQPVDEEKGESLIGQQTQVWWPNGQDGKVPDARKMSKKLRRDRESWNLCAVKILSMGELIEMKSQCKSKEATGFLKPTKEQRSKLAKRKWIESDADDEELETSESDQEEVESYNTNPQKIKTKKLKRKWTTSQTVVKSKRPASSAVLKGIGDNVLANKKSHHNRFNFSDEEETDDPSDDNAACTKNQLLDRIRVLQEENKRLRADNARLRAIKAVNDDIPTVKNFTKSLLEDLQLIKNSVDALRHETQRHQQESQPLMDNPTHVATTIAVGQSILEPPLCTPSERPLVQAINMDSIPAESIDESHNELLFFKGSPIQVKLEDINREASSMQTNDEIDENKIQFGSRQVDKHCISRIDPVKGITKFTASLCAIIFTDEELRTSSLTGHSCNFKKGSKTTKRQLAPDVVPHLIEFVLEKFPDGDRERNKKLIEQSIRTKCNNAAIQFKKKGTLQLTH